MALQDLTPQLRTRLSRMERAVGWFVFLATALLVFGFAYYVYHTAARKGWFLTKAPYFTLIERATGLKVGDPVMLMGFEVGQITRIQPMPPSEQYNVYVEFEIKDPNYGYLWTEGSRAKVASADFLGKRTLEVTKGKSGYPTYIFNPIQELALAQAQALPSPDQWKLAQDVYVENTNGLQVIIPAFTPLTKETLAQISALKHTTIRVLDSREQRKSMTGVWNDREWCYDIYTRTTKPYWLRADESPAVTERLEKIMLQVENALPNFLTLTNQITAVLSNSVELTSNLSALATEARPAATNLTSLSAQLRGPGALGEWMLGTNGPQRVSNVLENANIAITHADTNVTLLVENLARSLDNLSDITSNLNVQVQANTNILAEISDAVSHADQFVQGLKRHWLLRSAFRSKTNETSSVPRLLSPKDQGQQ